MATSPQSQSSERRREMAELSETDVVPEAEPQSPKAKSAAAKAQARKHEQAEPVFDEILADPQPGVATEVAEDAEQSSPAASAVVAPPPLEAWHPPPEVRHPPPEASQPPPEAPHPPAGTRYPPVEARYPPAEARRTRSEARRTRAEERQMRAEAQRTRAEARRTRAETRYPPAKRQVVSWTREDTDLIARAAPRDIGLPSVELSAGRPTGADLSRSPMPAGNGSWNCPFPREASRLGIDSAVVTLRVEVKANSAVESVIVIHDPGDGFGREARRCVMSKRWQAGLDRAGNAASRTTVVNIRFQRKS